LAAAQTKPRNGNRHKRTTTTKTIERSISGCRFELTKVELIGSFRVGRGVGVIRPRAGWVK
jgi:hypothetical protein